MKKGDTVRIFHDPQTKKKIEGYAKLIKKLTSSRFKGDQERWTVKFLSDGFICDRFVK